MLLLLVHMLLCWRGAALRLGSRRASRASDTAASGRLRLSLVQLLLVVLVVLVLMLLLVRLGSPTRLEARVAAI